MQYQFKSIHMNTYSLEDKNMRFFSKDAKMRKNEIMISIVDIICLAISIIILLVKPSLPMISFANLMAFAVLLLIMAVVFTFMLLYRFMINTGDKDSDK